MEMSNMISILTFDIVYIVAANGARDVGARLMAMAIWGTGGTYKVLRILLFADKENQLREEDMRQSRHLRVFQRLYLLLGFTSFFSWILIEVRLLLSDLETC
jgi:hypothetical protein